jgi:hypothetical protein
MMGALVSTGPEAALLFGHLLVIGLLRELKRSRCARQWVTSLRFRGYPRNFEQSLHRM